MATYVRPRCVVIYFMVLLVMSCCKIQESAWDHSLRASLASSSSCSVPPAPPVFCAEPATRWCSPSRWSGASHVETVNVFYPLPCVLKDLKHCIPFAAVISSLLIAWLCPASVMTRKRSVSWLEKTLRFVYTFNRVEVILQRVTGAQQEVTV